MINLQWIETAPANLLMVVLSGLGIYVTLLTLTRIAGLRSFSKMSSFDFAITIATGSVIASTLLNKQPSLFAGMTGLAVLYAIQYTVARSRRLSKMFERLVDNEPLLLMAGSRVLSRNLDRARITEGDLCSKLRLAGITHPDQVLAVILETTGDLAVLRCDQALDPWVLKHVRDSEEILANVRS